MNAKLHLISMLAASLALHGAAMPTEAEVEMAVPKVERMLASEKVALESGKMTRAEVAAAAMKLAAGADDEAAKLLLMKGAFILHVKDGDLEKAVKTMNALETAIADMPPQVITNIIETALLGLPNKTANGTRLYQLLDEMKAAEKVVVVNGENLKAVVDGYTWSYRVKNGEAEIVAEKDGKFTCAVSPRPKGSVVIPETLDGATVRIIGQNAFRDCGGLTSILIPAAVTSIRENAFYGCHGLNALTIPPAVREIGNVAFESCRELAVVTLPSNVVHVGRGIFADCTGLKQIDVEEGNPNYTSVDGVLYTKDRTELWMWPAGQRRVTIPDHVRVIGQWAFLKFDGLKSLTIPSTVTSIGWGAFHGCDGLASVTIPSSVGSIDGCAFRECGGLTSVTMEEGVTNIGRSVFCDCSDLKSVVIPSSLTRLDSNVFRGCRGLTAVTIPPNVTSIGWCAFCDCSGLKSVTIPSSVTSIGGCAFFRCGELASVTIPRNVTSIGKDAFYGCGYLSSVTMLGGHPNSPDNVFPKCANLKEIHAPANAKSWAGMTEWQGIPLVFDGADGIKDSSPEVHKAVESILKGMIKVPGRDYWLSATELTQEQWEPIMEFNLSKHKGAKLPVECVSRNDCDVFLEKLNQTKEVQESQFEFCLPTIEEWRYAAQAGGSGNDCWIKPGVVGNVLDMAWMKPNSSNETHVVATKAANAFGFYDMFGNVWEWTSGYDEKGHGRRKGCSFDSDPNIGWMLNCWIWIRDLNGRGGRDGLRLAAHKKVYPRRPLLGRLRKPDSSNNGQQGGSLRARWLQRQQEAQKAIHQEKVDGYTWSFRVNNGEAEIVADEKLRCAVSPSPTGRIAIPKILGGTTVASIGKEAFKGCGGLTSMTISENVKSIEQAVFYGCGNLTSVTLPQGLASIGANAFMQCRKLAPVTIPVSVTNIGEAAFAYCLEMKHIDVEVGNQTFTSIDGVVYTKDRAELVVCPSGKSAMSIPDSVMKIRNGSFTGCEGLTSLTIPPTVKRIGAWAFSGSRLTSLTLPQGLSVIEDATFWGCHNLTDVTIPDSVTSIGGNAFRWCGRLTSVTIPKGVKSVGGEAFYDCGGLTSITMCGERPEAPNNVFKGCRNLKSIHVPANAKSWAGMTEWQGIPLVFDAK